MKSAEEVARDYVNNIWIRHEDVERYAIPALTEVIRRDRHEQAQAVLPMIKRLVEHTRKWGFWTLTKAECRAAEAWLKSVEEAEHEQ